YVMETRGQALWRKSFVARVARASSPVRFLATRTSEARFRLDGQSRIQAFSGLSGAVRFTSYTATQTLNLKLETSVYSQPSFTPFFLFSSSSHFLSGAKYSSMALASIWRAPVSASSASGQGRLWPICSIFISFAPATLLL